MRIATNVTAIVLGGLLTLGAVVSAQPPETQPEARPGQAEQRPAPQATPMPRAGAPARSQAPAAPPPPPAEPGTAAAGRAEPNVLLEDLVRQVADETGRTFLIDPRAPTRIYVGGTVEGTPSYPVLLSILRNHGLTAYETEGVVNIIPDFLARVVPTRLAQTDDDAIPDDEIVTRVLTLPDTAQAAQLVPILRPMLSQSAHLTASGVTGAPASNKLVMVDSYANVKRITEVVRLLVGSVEL